MDRICGNCKYNVYEVDEDDFICDNPDSDNFGIYTDYNGECEYYEEREK
jgi:hypothetical protein